MGIGGTTPIKGLDARKVDLDHKVFCLEEARNKILREDEDRWRLKSRMLWLTGGDKNTRFFHRVASFRRNKKFLWEIEEEGGRLHQNYNRHQNRRHLTTSIPFTRKQCTQP
jgi:hypothetical protein